MKKIKIIGAGLFGCCIGYELNKRGFEVNIVEEDLDIMTKASKLNHNRIHFGYHYPRSLETAKQSLDGLEHFIEHYIESVVSGFPNYYMLSKENSNVSPTQYLEFCENLNINHEYNIYPPNNLINQDTISFSVKVYEGIYDYKILKRLVKNKIKDVNISFDTKFDGNTDDCDYVINTSYANINKINKTLGVPTLDLKFQDVVIPIFKMKSKPFGLTIMDGPFCSVMPKGREENRFLLYNPKYSVLGESYENNFKGDDFDIDIIYKESEKYFPFLSKVEPIGYWRTVRALPINNNDARMTKIFQNKSHPNVISVLSGKITTCHKIGIELSKIL